MSVEMEVVCHRSLQEALSVMRKRSDKPLQEGTTPQRNDCLLCPEETEPTQQVMNKTQYRKEVEDEFD